MNQNRRNRGVQATAAGVELLQTRRISENWTLLALANRAEISLDTLERLIRRDRVDKDSVRKIAHALNLQPTDIVDWSLDSSRVVADILISCHDSTVDAAQQLSNHLRTARQTVCVIETERRQSNQWFRRFTDALERCECYVLLLSPQAALSEMLTEEVRQVREHHNAHKRPRIVPIHIGQAVATNTDLDDYLRELQSWEWRSPTDLPTLVEAIQQQRSPSKRDDPVDAPIGPELPTGPVLLQSAFYIERSPIEAQCYQEVVYPGSLIRIKAPRQMGKTSLMARILHEARGQGYRTTHLSFQLATSDVLSNIDKLMRWFCLCVGQKLRLANQLAEYWDDIFDGNYNSTVYLEHYLLAEALHPLVIGLDEVDRVFAYPEVANDFFALLRAWYEKAKYGDQDSQTWQKLRLIVIHSTEVYIPMNLNQSPFNVGLSIELPEFTPQQVQDLAQRHALNWTAAQVEKLMYLVGGHPYLVRIAMYHVVHQTIVLEQILEQATAETGIYSDHLRRHLWNLEQYPELAAALSEVVTTKAPVPLKSVLAFKLHSMGLVTLSGNHATPRCDLYRQYFCEQSGTW